MLLPRIPLEDTVNERGGEGVVAMAIACPAARAAGHGVYEVDPATREIRRLVYRGSPEAVTSTPVRSF